jgi:hypothetical protein
MLTLPLTFVLNLLYRAMENSEGWVRLEAQTSTGGGHTVASAMCELGPFDSINSVYIIELVMSSGWRIIAFLYS